jgi:L-glutamine-phosphate cytidylyltransferase
MKVIILAAGMGSRLKPLTNNRPKCLVEFLGIPLLEYQLGVLERLGITDAHVITGYCGEQIDYGVLKRHVNVDFEISNMVESLFSSPSLFEDEDDIIITYGDVIYSDHVLKSLIAAPGPISITIDTNWYEYWLERMADPLSDAETLIVDESNKVRELGGKPKSFDEIQGQYMGLIKISSGNVGRVYQFWKNLSKKQGYDQRSIQNMYMTRFLQELINSEWDVHAVPVQNGWLEIDTPSDLDEKFVKFLTSD